MSFNVGDFKAKISEVGGLAKANKFAVLITPPRWTGDVNDGLGVTPGAQANLRFLCDTTNLPGKNLNTIDYMPQGFGAIHKTPIGVVHDPLSLTFLMDGNHHVMKFFQLWMQEIINTGSSFDGALASYKDRTDHEMSYKTNYVTTVILTFFSDDGNSQLEYHFADAYPVQLGSVPLVGNKTILSQSYLLSLHIAHIQYSRMFCLHEFLVDVAQICFKELRSWELLLAL
jgi:hypothetical protein